VEWSCLRNRSADQEAFVSHANAALTPRGRLRLARLIAMLHVDVNRFGNSPDGGGWRYVGRVQGERNRWATANRTGTRNARYEPRLGTAFVHTVVDDHSRIAYAEIRDDEKATTAIAVLRNAAALVQRPRREHRAGVVRQRLGLQIPRLTQRPRRARHPHQEDPAVPATHQREGRTPPPNPDRRPGTQTLLQLRKRPPAKPSPPGSSSTSTTDPHHNRRQTTHHPPGQPP
jgi:hypothetical protein